MTYPLFELVIIFGSVVFGCLSDTLFRKVSTLPKKAYRKYGINLVSEKRVGVALYVVSVILSVAVCGSVCTTLSAQNNNILI